MSPMDKHWPQELLAPSEAEGSGTAPSGVDGRPAWLVALGQRLATQDNRATAHPIFLVEQRRRDYGYDPAYGDDSNIVWIDSDADYREVPADERGWLDKEYDATGMEPAGYTRTAYRDRWEFVQPFFTQAAAEDYIRVNGHRLTDPRVYVDSGHRNAEWITLRAWLANPPAAPPIANDQSSPSTLAARSEPERRAESERCERCGQKRESTVHMTEHANAEIRTGAHGFVPAVNRYTLEQVALMLEEEARMGRLPGRAEVAIRWLRARAEERSHEG